MVLDLSFVAGAPMATAWAWTKMGDMNHDRELTLMDALMILQTAASTVQHSFGFFWWPWIDLIELIAIVVVRDQVPCYQQPVISAAG